MSWMKTVDKNLIINGVSVRSPSTLSILRGKTWTYNSGRALSNEFTGNRLPNKWRLDITWQALSEQEASEILAALDPAFFDVTFRNPRTGKQVTAKFYDGDDTIEVYNYATEGVTYSSISVSIVEK